jgi:hypothetical protein
MPRLNHRGEVVAGPGRVWFDDDTIISQRKVDGVWEIWTQRPDGTWLTREWPSGCNFIAADAGKFLATAPDIVFGSHSVPASYRLPAGQDGRGNAALDGTIALSKSPDNIGLVLKRADGSEQHEHDAHVDSRICVLNRTTALWIDTRDGKPRTMGSLPVPLALPGAIPFVGGVVFDRHSKPWWMYHGEDRVGVVLQPFDSFLGYHLGPIPAYYLHAVNTEDGRARITYALNPEETVVNATWVDWDAPRMDLRTLLGPIVLPPTDPPVDPPIEPPTMPDIPNRKDIVQRVRARYNTPLGALHAGFLLELAVEAEREMGLNVGLLRKPGGTRIALPDGVDVSQDFLTFRLSNGEVWGTDVLGDGENAATPGWGGSYEQFPSERFYDVIPGTVPPVDPPTDPPDPPDHSGLESRVVAIEAVLTTMAEEAEHLKARVKALEDFPIGQPLPKDVVRESTHKVVTTVNLLGRRDFDGKLERIKKDGD